jgi:hypothetical protein
LLDLAKLHRDDAVPDGVAHELLELEALRVGVDDKNTAATFGALIAKETERILKRKRAASGTEKVNADVIKDLLATPRQLAERLLVSGLIAKAKDIAEGKPGKDKPASERLNQDMTSNSGVVRPGRV